MRKELKYIVFAALMFGAVSTSPSASAARRTDASYTHFKRGQDLFDKGRWVDARLELLNASNDTSSLNNSDKQELEYLLTMCNINLKREGAIDQIFAFSEKFPYSPYNNETLYTRSILEMDRESLQRATELLNLVDTSRFSREDIDAYNIRMGYLAFHRKDFNEAQSFFSKIHHSSNYYPHALYFTSYLAYSEKNLSVARRGFETLADNAQYAPLMPYYLLHIEFLEGNYDKTISIGLKLTEKSTGTSTVGMLRLLAEAYFRIGDQNSAITYLNKYIESGGSIGRNEQYLKGFSLQITGDYAGAIEELKMVCGPDDALTQNAAFHLAHCYIRVDDKHSAMKAFSMAGNDQLNAEIAEEALFNYAKLQSDIDFGNNDKTINILTRYVNTYDNEERLPIIQNLLIAAYYNMRDYDTAYKKISRIENPDSNLRAAKQKITYLRALERYIDGDYNLSEELLNESISIGITPKQIALANFWLGEIRYGRGEYKDAIDRYNYFVARAPVGEKTIAAANYSTAYALFMQGNKSSAMSYFLRYLSSNDSEDRLKSDTYNRIGDIYYSNRQFDRANSNYQSAIKLAEETKDAGDKIELINYAKFQIAMIKGLQGDSKTKIDLLSDIQSGRYADNAAYESGRAYVDLGDYQSAIRRYLRFIDKYQSSELYTQVLSSLGVAYSNIKDTKSALSYYDLAIKSAPQSQVAIDALNGIRELYVSRGEAKKYFEYAKSIGLDGDLNVAARDSLSFASARELYLAGGKTREGQRLASRALSEYADNYPKGYYLNDALFFASDAYVKAGEPKEAIKRLTQLTNRGESNYSERGYKMLSKLTLDEKMYRESAAASRKLYEVSNEQTTKEAAMSDYAKATILMGNEKGIEAMVEELMKRGERNVGTTAFLEAKLARATILRERGERKDALPLYEDIAKRHTDKERVGEATYYIIENAFRLGNLNSAEQMVYSFSEKRGGSSYWLAKSFLLLGDIYVKREDKFQARATFQSVLDGYSNSDDGIIKEAKRKINQL